MSLFSAAERFASLDRSSLMFKGDNCLYSHDKFSGCEACFAICPAEAIAPGKPPVFDPAKCVNCLACLTVCPVGAYDADDGVVHLLNTAARLENGPLELICGKNPRSTVGNSPSATAVRLPGCLAGMGAGAYLSLAAMGLEAVQVRLDGCRDCEWKALENHILAQIEQAEQLLTVWGKADLFRRVVSVENPVDRPLWEAKNPPLSRRDMFRMIAQQGKVAVARTIEKERSLAAHQPGRNRLRILGALKHLSGPVKDGSIRMDRQGLASLAVSDDCTACAVCARACPTHALSYEKNEAGTEFTLKFSARMCVDCEMCQHVCMPSAITIDPSPTFDQVFIEDTVVVKTGELAVCESCGIPIAARPGARLCSFCQQRKDHPFGSVLTPEMKQRLTRRPEARK